MQVKVFEAEDMRSALAKVKNELGPEALILSTRPISKKTLGLRGNPGIEVTAAVDAGEDRPKQPAAGQPGGTGKSSDGSTRRQQERTGRLPQAYTTTSFQHYLEDQVQTGDRRNDTGREHDLMREIRQMKESFHGLLQEFSEVKGGWARQGPIPGRQGQDFDFDEAGKEFLTELSECGFQGRFLQAFAELVEQDGQALRDGSEDMNDFLERGIAQVLRMNLPFAEEWNDQKRLAFIGPTGVGKTTTIAKIAATCLLDFGKSVALVTIDNYRIAAVEQLKIYGQIMNIPVEMARNPKELETIFLRQQDKDVILVDTAGRSPGDELSRGELAAFLDPALEVDNHLVLSATTREQDLHLVIDRFGQLPLAGLVFTKLDECRDLGAVFNLPVTTNYPLSFLTNGQRVPEDLLLPDARQLAELTLKKKEETEKWTIKGNGTRPERYVH